MTIFLVTFYGMLVVASIVGAVCGIVQIAIGLKQELFG